MKLYQNKSKVFVVKCDKPKFSYKKGATWDSGNIFIDDIKFDAHLDTSWGKFCYFCKNGQWYKIKMISSLEEDYKDNKYDIDVWNNNMNNLTTTI
jgi:hypothetical protein